MLLKIKCPTNGTPRRLVGKGEVMSEKKLENGSDEAIKTREAQRLKQLFLARMFFQETDAEHGMSMTQILGYLQERGVSAERKAVYRDIEALRSFGLDIVTLPRKPPEYALVSRIFSKTELALLTDAVQSSRFLTKTQAQRLARSIRTLASRHDARTLSKQLHVEGRIKMQNDSVFKNVDIIQEALRLRRQIAFLYFKYDVNVKERMQHGGDLYVETPLALIYSNDYYYLVAYNEKHDDLVHYRVDRMRALMCTDKRALSNDKTRSFDVTEYLGCAFGMYRGQRHVVTLLVREDAMSGMVDRFGKNLRATLAKDQPEEERWARVSATVMESPAFFSWLVQFGNRVRIESPSSLAKRYAAYLEDIARAYRDEPASKADISAKNSLP